MSLMAPPPGCRARAAPALWLAAGLALLAGCVAPRGEPSRASSLAAQIRNLSPTVDPVEAQTVAETACAYSLALAEEYRVVRPAIFHNVLVNLGIRERGLCFQWADDLSARLAALPLRSLQLHRGAARLETRREHSCVVLAAVGQPFVEGLALDAWRRSGRLVWAPVVGDKYPWIEVEVLPEAGKGREDQTP